MHTHASLSERAGARPFPAIASGGCFWVMRVAVEFRCLWAVRAVSTNSIVHRAL